MDVLISVLFLGPLCLMVWGFSLWALVLLSFHVKEVVDDYVYQRRNRGGGDADVAD